MAGFGACRSRHPSRFASFLTSASLLSCRDLLSILSFVSQVFCGLAEWLFSVFFQGDHAPCGLMWKLPQAPRPWRTGLAACDPTKQASRSSPSTSFRSLHTVAFPNWIFCIAPAGHIIGCLDPLPAARQLEILPQDHMACSGLAKTWKTAVLQNCPEHLLHC